MPIFDYTCNDCEVVFEKLWIGKEGIAICPECGGVNTEKKMSASGQSFRLYGEGFYRRDHKDTGDWS
jgi:putative FmdB family regulatory protein